MSGQVLAPFPPVCVISPLYHPTLGGLGRQAMLVTEHLRKAGVPIFVISRRMSGVPIAHFSPDVEIVSIPSLFQEEHILERITLKNILISISFSLGCLAMLIRRRKTYAIAHFQGGSIPLFLSFPFLKLMGKRVVVMVASVQGTEPGSLAGRHWIFGNLLARMLRRVDRYVAISKEIEEGLLRDGIPAGRITYVPSFVDTGTFHPLTAGEKEKRKAEIGISGNSVAVFSGRLAPIKGVDHLLKSWRSVVSDLPEARLLLLGDGPSREDFESMAARLGISETVKFAGMVTEVQSYLQAGDVYVLSSHIEGLPNSLLEAMATALPVVATRVGGVPDVVEEGRSGFLVDPADSPGFADRLTRLLQDASLRERMGRAALSTILDRFGQEAIVIRYLQIYRGLDGQAMETNG